MESAGKRERGWLVGKSAFYDPFLCTCLCAKIPVKGIGRVRYGLHVDVIVKYLFSVLCLIVIRRVLLSDIIFDSIMSEKL